MLPLLSNLMKVIHTSGVLVVTPNAALFQAIVDKVGDLNSYDGGDTGKQKTTSVTQCSHLPRIATLNKALIGRYCFAMSIGFLNAYFTDWYQSGPASRLPFGYNAQRTLYWFTHKDRPGYWNAIQPLKVMFYAFVCKRSHVIHSPMCVRRSYVYPPTFNLITLAPLPRTSNGSDHPFQQQPQAMGVWRGWEGNGWVGKDCPQYLSRCSGRVLGPNLTLVWCCAR